MTDDESSVESLEEKRAREKEEQDTKKIREYLKVNPEGATLPNIVSCLGYEFNIGKEYTRNLLNAIVEVKLSGGKYVLKEAEEKPEPTRTVEAIKNDPMELEYQRKQRQQDKEYEEKVWAGEPVTDEEEVVVKPTLTLRKKKELPPELCQSCQYFYECEKTKRNERLNKIIRDCVEYKNIAELPYRTLQDVYDVFNKWLVHLDTTRIDTRLAWYISNEFEPGDPVWIAEAARSAYTKTTLSDSLSESPKVIPVGTLTPKALISGKTKKEKNIEVPVSDLGMRLNRRNRCISVAESATLKAMHEGSKRQLFGDLKQLYDGYLKADTGTGVSKYYKECNASLWMNSTPDIQKEVIIQQEIGSCLMVDFHPLDTTHDEEASEKAIANRHKHKQIKEETTYVVKCYLAHHHLKDIQFDEEEEKFFVKEANRLKWIRTTGSFDNKDELEYTPQPEYPTRIAIQLSKLYQSLMSLDEKYEKERAKRIIRRIVDGSGDLVMVKILDYINARYWTIKEAKDENTPFTVTDIVVNTGLGTRTIKRRLEIFTALNFLRKSWKASEKESEKESEGKKKGGGGPSGYQYKLRDDILGKDWESLFRHRIFKK